MKKTLPVSVVIISKNEENNIKRCLESVKWADEIVILDTGSIDNTLSICKEYGCSVYKLDRWEGFGKAKHQAVNNAKYDWIFSIDCDEEVSEELKQKIFSILDTHQLEKEEKIKAYRIKRESYYMGKLVRFSGWQRDFPLRLFNKRYGNFNHKIVHEHVETSSEIEFIYEKLYHYTYPMIKTHISKTVYYSELAALQAFNKKKKSGITKAILRGLVTFIKMYIINFGFLDGKVGLILAINSAFGTYLRYLYLWELYYSSY